MPTESESTASVAVVQLEPFALSPKETGIVENCGESTVYERLARGEYDAVKDGTRTKITFESIKRRRAGLPRATYQPLNRAPTTAAGNILKTELTAAWAAAFVGWPRSNEMTPGWRNTRAP
jgi:hypothetical protein